ncbi:MAG: nucleotidyltransferase family protein [Sphingomonadales bacterium]|nr:nucleotidyltransferase family protein [Sphingomonadales bacterium]MDE2570333.1 nucleotidyltransferase family protein [Sphingomonadales bacterium]
MVAALLAAGRSARFGAADKLARDFRGVPLGLHAARALETVDLTRHWVIVRDAAHPCAQGWRAAGFELVVNPQADEGMGASLRLAARLADEAGADSLLVCLADMPLVTTAHIAALAGAWRARGGVVASRDGALVSPPAIFAREHFAALAGLAGDRGAKALLGQAGLVDSPVGALADIDDPATLARLAR